MLWKVILPQEADAAHLVHAPCLAGPLSPERDIQQVLILANLGSCHTLLCPSSELCAQPACKEWQRPKRPGRLRLPPSQGWCGASIAVVRKRVSEATASLPWVSCEKVCWHHWQGICFSDFLLCAQEQLVCVRAYHHHV